MIVIATGMDNTGKTTLVGNFSDFRTGLLMKLGRNQLDREVVKDLMGEVIPRTSLGPKFTKGEKHHWLETQIWEEFEERNNPNLNEPAKVFLYDRFLPFEEMVYGRVLRGESAFELSDECMNRLKNLNPLIIYTRPQSDVIFNFGDREQMEGVIERSRELLRAWDDLIFNLIAEGWNIIIYDYSKQI